MRLWQRPANDAATLLVAGAGAGACAGALTAVAVLLTADVSLTPFPIDVPVVGAGIGGVLGAPLFPIVVRVAIPDVPLRRATLSTIAGTVIGGTLESLLSHHLGVVVFGAVVGFVLTVIGLAFTHTSRS